MSLLTATTNLVPPFVPSRNNAILQPANPHREGEFGPKEAKVIMAVFVEKEIFHSEIKRINGEIHQTEKSQEKNASDLLKRFDKTDAHFDKLENSIDLRFKKVDACFDKVDARFEKVEARFEKVEARFDKVDARFEKLESKIDGKFYAIVTIYLSGLGVILAAFYGFATYIK
jgi:chaperonin cofactor prefoldin